MQIKIQLDGVGKRFYQRWIFRNISKVITPDHPLAIVGGNGSGKSTLLRIISGQLSPSEGKVIYTENSKKLSYERWYQLISWSAPALEIYLELSLLEFWNLHFRLKACYFQSLEEMSSLLELANHQDKKLRYYSSGMLQRVKVGTALFSKTNIILLDEPTSNLDTYNTELVLDLINKYTLNRVYILASNIPREFENMEERISLVSQ